MRQNAEARLVIDVHANTRTLRYRRVLKLSRRVLKILKLSLYLCRSPSLYVSFSLSLIHTHKHALSHTHTHTPIHTHTRTHCESTHCQFVCAWIRDLLGVRRRRAPQVYLCTGTSEKTTPGISVLCVCVCVCDDDCFYYCLCVCVCECECVCVCVY